MKLTVRAANLLFAAALLACNGAGREAKGDDRVKTDHTAVKNDAWALSPTDATIKVEKTDEEWKQLLTPIQFQVLRQAGTERAFTGDTWNNHEHGVYRCAACGLVLFLSDDKFESGTGWPSFTRPAAPGRVVEREDRSFFMTRTEVHCPRCGGHLGHVFPDGPAPTGLRYCMNSAALKFEKQ